MVAGPLALAQLMSLWPEWQPGQKAEYFSPSYNEWIECRIAQVRYDGNLKLEHNDGSGVLKESADPSRVRRTEPSSVVPEVPVVSVPVSQPDASGSGSGSAPVERTLSTSPKAAVPTPPRRVSGNSPRTGVGRQISGISRVGAVPSRPSVAAPLSGADRIARLANKPLDSTINARDMYVGDRVTIKGAGRTGEVMYIGPAMFAGADIVVGIKLDDKRTTSDCDGKYKGERYFRCQAGYGIYQAKDEVELIPPEKVDEDLRHVAISPAPDMESFDLEQELESLIGLKEVKDALKHVRNFIQVQQRRSSVVGDSNTRALHFAFLHGGPGSGCSTVARLLAGMLLKLGVLNLGQVVEVARRDLLAGSNSGDAEVKLKKMVKASEGGVLVLNDIDTYKDNERSDRLGDEALQALSKHLEASAMCLEWPQRTCVVVTGKRGSLSKCLEEHASIGSAVYARFEFSDLTPKEVGQILRILVENNKFQLSEDLTDEKVERLVRRRQLRGGDGGTAPRNVRLARALLDDAVGRQTDRIWAKETMSLTGLTALVEEDFEPKGKKGQEEASQLALKKLDSIVGLKSVKEFVRSLHAQLQVEQQRREMGIEAPGGPATLHMVFQGNPGTGKTTVARVVADLLKALGLLRTGHLVEADRSALVAGYSGQTALKTKAVVESALGGVLFVDEAYALVGEDGKDTFGREALDTLIKLVEDYRNDLVVVLAGYSKEMKKLMDANPGMQSRFPTVLEFDDYSAEQLLEIADQMLLQDVLHLSMDANERLRELLHQVSPKPNEGAGDATARASGNGRAVRNILERAKRNQALRLASGGQHNQEELCTLVAADFDGCILGTT